MVEKISFFSALARFDVTMIMKFYDDDDDDDDDDCPSWHNLYF